MKNFSDILRERNATFKKASFWLQIANLFFALMSFIYINHLLALQKNNKPAAIITTTETTNLLLWFLLAITVSALLLVLILIYNQRKNWNQFTLMSQLLTAGVGVVISVLLVDNLAASNLILLEKNHYLLLGLALLALISAVATFRNLYRNKSYLLNKEGFQRLHADIKEWFSKLFQNSKNFFRSVGNAVKNLFAAKPDVTTEPTAKKRGRKKKVPEVTTELEERIADTFKKPLLLRKSVIVFLLFAFTYLSVGAYNSLVDWSKDTIDVFEGMTVSFHGISGEGYAKIETMPNSNDPQLNEFLSTLSFRIENNSNLYNGDKIRVVLTNYDASLLNEHNYKFEATSKEFHIDRLSTIPESLTADNGKDTVVAEMDEIMRKRQAFMTQYHYEPIIECYAMAPHGTTHYTYFIESKYGVFLRVYDVKESFSYHNNNTSFDYAYLVIFDHIVVDSSGNITDFQPFVTARIGEVDYLDYVLSLRRNNNFSCSYLGEE